MKEVLFVLLLMIGSFSVNAQDLSWTNNLDKAIDISNKSKKPLLLFFTGSDWCGWCKRLQKEVFQKPEFAAWAKENVVLMEVDFPRMSQLAPDLQAQNNQLQQFFQVQGFPTICFVNAAKKDGKINFEKLGNLGYVAGGPDPWLGAANVILKKK